MWHSDARHGRRSSLSTAVSGRRQEPDAPYRAMRVGHPPPHRRSPGRQSGFEQCLVALHSTAIRGTLLDGQHDADSGRVPAESFSSHERRQSRLLVQSSKCRFRRCELGLDFDNEKRGARMVPGKDVDGATPPNRAYDTSTRTSQPSARSLPAQVPERDACRSSRSRSSSPPRQWTSTTTIASRAPRTRRSRSREMVPMRPRSMSETVDCPTPAWPARST